MKRSRVKRSENLLKDSQKDNLQYLDKVKSLKKEVLKLKVSVLKLIRFKERFFEFIETLIAKRRNHS